MMGLWNRCAVMLWAWGKGMFWCFVTKVVCYIGCWVSGVWKIADCSFSVLQSGWNAVESERRNTER